jgi:hypothetical protein
VERVQTATVTVTATDKLSAKEEANQYDEDSFDWYDGGSVITDVETDNDNPINDDDMEAWDELYGHKYTEFGEAMCSECGETGQEYIDNADGTRWLCGNCI